MRRVGIIGDGAWGTALALHLDRLGRAVTVWGPFEKEVAAVRADRENRRYFPGFPIPASIGWSAEPEAAVAGADAVVMAVPSRHVAAVAARFAPHVAGADLAVSVTKGLEPESGRRMTEVVRAAWAPLPVAALSGPSFADEVARGLPTAVVAASACPGAAAAVQEVFSGDTFRVYTSEDGVGVELGGVLKNVVALAAGASDALGFGTNARAALITRGLAEMTRIGVALGAHAATFAGLSGLGDLVLTCTGPLSRNRRVGERIGQGESLDAILASMPHVAEGVANCETVRALARAHGVSTPIVNMVYRVLFEGVSPQEAVTSLMGREPKPERDARDRPGHSGQEQGT